MSVLLVNFAMRLSMIFWRQRSRSLPKTMRWNFPVLRVGLPQAKIIGSPSVRPPSAAFQISSGIAEASSNRYQDVDRAACWPWKASEFSRRHVWAVTNQESGAAFAQVFCVPGSNQCDVMLRRVHLRIAGQVLEESCGKVFAVTVPCECGRVDPVGDPGRGRALADAVAARDGLADGQHGVQAVKAPLAYLAPD